MAKKGNRSWVKVVNKETGSTYMTERNKVNQSVKAGAGKNAKITIKKYDPRLRKHVEHVEAK